MPLTHVCIWSGRRWKPITAKQAAKLQAGGTISARSGLFMCSICGQHVALTSKNIREPYFKHSSAEKSKDCSERTFGPKVSYHFSLNVPTLPIRLRLLSETAFELEIGFVALPPSSRGGRHPEEEKRSDGEQKETGQTEGQQETVERSEEKQEETGQTEGQQEKVERSEEKQEETGQTEGQQETVERAKEDSGVHKSTGEDTGAEKGPGKIVITGEGLPETSFQYSLERLQERACTYLSVGQIPATRYHISYPSSSLEAPYWPEELDGISREGTFFDGVSGKKLPEDSDVCVNRRYHLLTAKKIPKKAHFQSLDIKLLCEAKGLSRDRWHLYSVEALSYEEEAARFFMDYHVRLTDHPIELYPLWPEYIHLPYRILHNSSSVWFYASGEGIKPRVYPSTNAHSYPLADKGTLLYFDCKASRHFLSAGRSKVLKYMYLQKETPPAGEEEPPRALVTDQRGEEVSKGELPRLPQGGVLRICLPYDGTVEVTEPDGFLVRRAPLCAQTPFLLDQLGYRQCIKVYCGLDLVWSASLPERKRRAAPEQEMKLLKELSSFKGDEIPVPHALGGMLERLSGREELKAWVRLQLRKGLLSRRALRLLVKEIQEK